MRNLRKLRLKAGVSVDEAWEALAIAGVELHSAVEEAGAAELCGIVLRDLMLSNFRLLITMEVIEYPSSTGPSSGNSCAEFS